MPRVFAIADLHLSFRGDKPMDRFGPVWVRHWEKVEQHWRERISTEDLVLMPGDHSWGLRLEDARQDLEFIQSLPGVKVLSRGNHDYWWQSLSKLRKAFPGLRFLQNDSVRFGDLAVCGTRGWDLRPVRGFADPHDEQIYVREVERLRLSIASMPEDAACRIAMIHYPPLLPGQKDTEFSRLLSDSGIQVCVYGHLHLANIDDESSGPPPKGFQGEYRGVRYYLVACDRLGMVPLEIPVLRTEVCS
ncbi:MAG: metallophosphoesterase [Candidatus Eremiobacterota bacterium]